VKPAGVRIAAAVLSGLLLAAAFPKLEQAWLAWIGFVPLLLAVRGIGARRAALLGWITGFVWQVATIYWIPSTISNFTAIPPIAAKMILVLLAGFSAYPFVILAAFSEWISQARPARVPEGGLSRLLTLPAVWVVAEWLRVVVIAGFPWNPVGNTQIAYVTMAQAADLGGVYLLSAIIVLANVAIVEALAARRAGAGSMMVPAIAGRLAIAVACPLLLFAYGMWRLDELDAIPYTGSLKVGIAQGNIAQDEKWNQRLRDRILEKYLDLTNQAASAGAQLVVWPEAALPFYIQRDMRSLELTRVARERGIDLLVGAPGIVEHEGGSLTPYNQAWLVRSSGDVEGPYNKIQLVPFGEYIPFYGLFGMVKVAVQSVGQLGAGTEYKIFDTVELSPPAAAGSASNAPPRATSGAAEAGTASATAATASAPGAAKRPARFATLICYEGIFPTLTRSFAAEGADFLVNISNDAWYGDTSAPHQHLAMAAMRTIENRLPMVRSTNTGISAFITDEGRIGPVTPLFHEDMVVETVLVRDVWSFYRAYGDVFLHLCQAFVAVVLVAGAYRRRMLRAARRAATPP